MKTPSAEQLACQFHLAYERLAVAHDYETRKESAVPWKDVPEKNRNLMIEVCKNVMLPHIVQRDKRIEHFEEVVEYQTAAIARLKRVTNDLEPIWWRICSGISFQGYRIREFRAWGFLWTRTEILYRDADGWHVGNINPRHVVKRTKGQAG